MKSCFISDAKISDKFISLVYNRPDLAAYFLREVIIMENRNNNSENKNQQNSTAKKQQSSENKKQQSSENCKKYNAENKNPTDRGY